MPLDHHAGPEQTDIEDHAPGRGAPKKRRIGGIAEDRLLAFIERIEHIEAEMDELKELRKSVYGEVQMAGFDTKVTRQMVRERKMAHDELEEWTGLCELYRAALGMLDGTPLGEAARKRLDPRTLPPPSPPKATAPRPEPDPFAFAPPSDGAVHEEAPEPPPPPPGPADIATARAQGGLDGKAGKSVLENPWPYGDVRRAAWDEGFCAAIGSDGMEVPDAWRRTKPKKGGDEKGAGA